MTIGRTARLAGVSVRTLHHYDQIGLLRPAVTEAGYRIYGDAELKRLWQILFYRELGFSLGQIRAMLENPACGGREALQSQRRLLEEKKERLEKIIGDIDTILAKGFEANMLKTFGSESLNEHKTRYAREAAEKYGETYRQAEQKTAHYREQDWREAMEQAQEIFDHLASCMEKGPDAPETMAWVGKWRAYLSARFYDCTPELLRGLGELYVTDGRFTRNIDKTRPGLAAFLKEAFEAYSRANP